jgi:hypothetical protein
MKARAQQRALKQSHREINAQLSSIAAQLKAQADSTFGDATPWGKAGLAGFGDSLIAHAKAFAELGENFNAGKPPQWVPNQQDAYENSAIGQLSRAEQSSNAATD